MKRIIMMLLAALLLLLAGCGSRQPQVGICFRDCDDPVTESYRQKLEQALTQAGYAVTVMDARNDQSEQDRQVQQLLEEKADILILEPVMISALDSVAQQAQGADVPVVFVNREPEGQLLQNWQKACYVGCDAQQPGFVQGQMAVQLPDGGDLNGDGIVAYAVIAGPQDHLDAQLRSDGCVRALEESGIQAEAVAVEYGTWDREDAQRRCAKMLATYGKDIEVIFCNSDELAVGAIDAIRDGGRTVGQNLYLFGIDGQRQSLLLIRSGDLTGTVSLDIPGQVQDVLSAVQELLAGNTPKKISYVNHIGITKEKVDEYIED